MGAAEVVPSFESRRRLSGARLGRYHIGARIGAGGSAAVYLARPREATSADDVCAIKVVHDHLSEEKEFISQFLDEANLLVRVAHPNIVRVYELGREGETLFLAMEYLHGQPLSRLTSALARRNSRLDPVLAAWLGARVAEGLAYAHALKDDAGDPLGLVHRDVSPQNVFVTYGGDVKLIDFGIARAAGRIAQTTLGRIKGKFSYMAPEQVLGKDFDHRADLFALGATLYEAAVGSRLFAGIDESETLHKLLFESVPDPRTRVPGFPDELARILGRALESEPDRRYASGIELARELDAFVRASGVSDPSSALAVAVARLFQTEKAEQQKAIDALAALDDTPPEVAVLGRTSGVVSRPPISKPPTPMWVHAAIGFGIVVVLGGAVLALRAQTRVPAAAASAAPVSTEVTLEVTTQPDVDGEIRVDGQRATGKPPRVSLPRSSTAVTVEVVAPGFEPAKTLVVPDRDRGVMIPLTRVTPPPPPASADKSEAAEKPEKTKVPPSSGKTPGTTPKKGDPLVTKYPFGK